MEAITANIDIHNFVENMRWIRNINAKMALGICSSRFARSIFNVSPIIVLEAMHLFAKKTTTHPRDMMALHSVM